MTGASPLKTEWAGPAWKAATSLDELGAAHKHPTDTISAEPIKAYVHAQKQYNQTNTCTSIILFPVHTTSHTQHYRHHPPASVKACTWPLSQAREKEAENSPVRPGGGANSTRRWSHDPGVRFRERGETVKQPTCSDCSEGACNHTTSGGEDTMYSYVHVHTFRTCTCTCILYMCIIILYIVHRMLRMSYLRITPYVPCYLQPCPQSWQQRQPAP